MPSAYFFLSLSLVLADWTGNLFHPLYGPPSLLISSGFKSCHHLKKFFSRFYSQFYVIDCTSFGLFFYLTSPALNSYTLRRAKCCYCLWLYNYSGPLALAVAVLLLSRQFLQNLLLTLQKKPMERQPIYTHIYLKKKKKSGIAVFWIIWESNYKDSKGKYVIQDSLDVPSTGFKNTR